MAERSKAYDISEEETLLSYARGQRAYLITVHSPLKKGTAPFVTVQASHCNRARRFADLDSAFHYLLSLTQTKEGKKPEP